MLPREHVQGQEAVFVVERVEEPPFLPAVDGVVGRVEVQDYFSRRLLEGGDEGVDEHSPDGIPVPFDPVVPVALGFAHGTELKPVERALPRHGSILSLAGADDAEQRVVAPVLVVIEVLIALADSEDPLLEQFLEPECHQFGIAVVDASVSQCPDEAPSPLDLPEEKKAAITGGRFAVVPDDYFPSLRALQSQLELATLCFHTGRPSLAVICLW